MFPATWQLKDDQYSVSKAGYIIISFFNLSEESRIEIDSKKVFVLTAKNFDVILDLDTKAPFQESEQNEDMMFHQKGEVMSILKVKKQKDRSFSFTYCEMDD